MGLICLWLLPGCRTNGRAPGGHDETGQVPQHLAGARCGDGKCDTTRKEDCAGCPRDCGRCTGCQPTLASGCFGCKCERCVCAKLSSCCGDTGQWGPRCVKACKQTCGGCGDGDTGVRSMSVGGRSTTSGGARWECGDGKCEVDSGEDCGLCQKDCGVCNGCQQRFVGGCQRCACEACVCDKIPTCCTSRWGADCVKACRQQCGGCGLSAGKKRAKAAAKKAPLAATRCGNGSCEPGRGEDCVVCPRDCHICDGCQTKLGPGCLGCKCESCVCKLRPRCCKAGSAWDKQCVTLCRQKCGGCGLAR